MYFLRQLYFYKPYLTVAWVDNQVHYRFLSKYGHTKLLPVISLLLQKMNSIHLRAGQQLSIQHVFQDSTHHCQFTYYCILHF